MALSDRFDQFVDYLIRHGLEYFRRYYGPYRARVVNNQDPEGLGRIIVECPRARLPARNSDWVVPMMTGAGKQYGMFWPPEQDDYVFVFFDNGDPLKPMAYMGGWYAGEEVRPEFTPEQNAIPKKRGIATPGGHFIAFSDVAGAETITIQHKNGTLIQWGSDNTIKLGKEDGTFEQMFKAETTKEWLVTHTHPSPMGPTGPAVETFPEAGLSKVAKNS